MPRTILTVSTWDRAGGAERAARELHCEYIRRGEDAWFAAGEVRAPHERTLLISNRARRSTWARACMAVADALPQRRAGFHTARLLRGPVAEPSRWWRARRGEEDFDHPGTAELLSLTPRPPDALHLHNLHGGYFDLRTLPALSARVPTIVTLHDAWLLSGHCSHSFSCERWESGCGHCPALWIYPKIPRDRTALNWERKRLLYASSRLYVASPSVWLADKVRRSMLMSAVRDLRVIPYGIDLTVFTPGDRAKAKIALGLDPVRPMILTFAASLQAHTWRDAEAFRGALARLSGPAVHAQWIALGESGADVVVGPVRVERRGPEREDARMVLWYQAADAYVHAARADTFPFMVLESLACGTPVIGSAVGGIPEQVRGAGILSASAGASGIGEATGAIVPPFDASALARAIMAFFGQPVSVQATLGANAARDARARFDIHRHADDYLAWMGELTETS